jgi:hypothetical protein
VTHYYNVLIRYVAPPIYVKININIIRNKYHSTKGAECVRRSLYIAGFLVVLSILLAGVVSATVPDNSTTNLTTNKEWMVANGADTAVISLKAVNASNPIGNLPVSFSINDTSLATILSTTAVTGPDGIASVQIGAKKKSGTVLVYATVQYRFNESDQSEPLKSVTYTYPQKIDHDTPYMITYDTFPDQIVTVGTEIPVQIQIRDEWGNLVENRNPATQEMINLSVQGSPHDLAGIVNNTELVKVLTVPVDNLGYFSAIAKLSTYPGFHSFLVKPLDMPVSEKPYYVRTVANGIPVNITSRIEIAEGGIGDALATPPEATADGYTKFFVTYTLYDQYGNPVSDKVLNFFTNRSGEGRTLPASTDLGQVKIYYGPSDEVTYVNMTVNAVENTSVTRTDTVNFISGRPADLSNLTAYPEVMPSIDAYAGSTSELKARVTTAGGFGVPGETVYFSMGTPGYADLPSYHITSEPSFSSSSHITSTSAITDSNGYATVTFTPGGFGVYGDPKYVASATGWVTATATWNSSPHSILLTWKNYPYLSAETSVSPQIVNVSDNVTVTLRLKGDGYKLQPVPADIVLVTDLAGGVGSGQLLGYTKAADIAFVNNANNTTSIGLVSFGYNNPAPYNNESKTMFDSQGGVPTATKLFNPYGNVWDYCLVNPTKWDQSTAQRPDSILVAGTPHYNATPGWNAQSPYSYFNSYSDATIDSPLRPKSDKAALITEINKYQGKGGTDYAAGINAAIQLFEAQNNTGHRKAIIIMGDGIPMMAPIAPGSLKSYWPSDWYPRQNLGWEDESDIAIEAAVDAARRAESKGITVYAAGFPLNNQVDNNTLKRIVSSGEYEPYDRYYFTPDPSKLSDLLLTIQGRIQKEEYVNTSTDLDYGMVHVTQDNVDTMLPGVFTYVYQPPVSTMNRTYWRTSPSSNIEGPHYYDQTADWADNNLSFDVGTIKLNQVWMTTYMLKVNKVGPISDKPGVVDAFGAGSIVSFNDNTSFLSIPKTPITVLPNLSEEKATKKLVIDNLTATTNGTIADLWVDIQILPNSPNLSVTADIYITDTDQHTTTWIKSVELGPIVNGNMKVTSVDLSHYPKGKKYTFYVDFINKQPGTNPIYWASLTSNGFVVLSKPTGVYIKLE